MTTFKEEEDIIDDCYDDEDEIKNINEYIMVINKKKIDIPSNEAKTSIDRNYICDCRRCLEFIPHNFNQTCISCGCNLINHLTDEDGYDSTDFEEEFDVI